MNDMMGFEDLTGEIRKLQEERLTKAQQESAEYRQEHENVFDRTQEMVHGGTDYMKIRHLKKKPKAKGGVLTRMYRAVTKSRESDYEASRNEAKAKSRKGLYDGEDEGIFANEADRREEAFMRSLSDRCQTLYQISYASPRFLETLKVVDTYLTAEDYKAQQKALGDVFEAFKKYKEETPGNMDEFEEKLLARITSLERDLNARVSGSLVVPEDLVLSPKPAMGAGHFSSRKKMKLFPHEPSPNDVKQRYVSDCYMMSALTSLAFSNPEYIRNSMRDNGDTVTVRFFDPDQNYAARYITVEKKVPAVIFGVQKDAVDCLWVQMIERAFAVFYGNGSYGALNYNTSHEFMARFVGRQYAGEPSALLPKDDCSADEEGVYKDVPKYNPALSPVYSGVAARLYESFNTRLRGQVNGVNLGPAEVITVGIDKDSSRAKKAKSRGFRTAHAYSVLKVFEKTENDVTLKYVRLRDPYGAYSVGYENGKSKDTGNMTSFKATDTMGTFDLEWNDFLNTFTSYSGCISDNRPDLLCPAYVERIRREAEAADQKRRAEQEKKRQELRKQGKSEAEILFQTSELADFVVEDMK